MSRSYRTTVAALAFSEAAAGMMLASGPDQAEITEAAQYIQQYCNEAYHHLPRALSNRDIKKFKRCLEQINQHFSDGARVDAQKIIGFCCFLLEEPITSTRNRPLLSCMRSIADLMVWIAGILEQKDGADAFQPLTEADEALRIWGDSGWV